MKKFEHPPFDVDYLSITFFINKNNALEDNKIDSKEFFKFYKNERFTLDSCKGTFYL